MKNNAPTYNNTDEFTGKTIAIIGIDGSGKSTCFNQVIQDLHRKNIAAIGDRVLYKREYKIKTVMLMLAKLKELVGKKVKQIKSRKLYRILKFLELLMRVKLLYIIDRKYRPAIIITDGSPLINILGWGHYYCPDIYSKDLLVEVTRYMTGKRVPQDRKAFFKKHAREILLIRKLGIRFHIPDMIFFLKVSPHIALERINKRNEALQTHETNDFLSNLQSSYQMVCELLPDCNVNYIITDNKDIETVVSEVVREINQNIV